MVYLYLILIVLIVCFGLTIYYYQGAVNCWKIVDKNKNEIIENLNIINENKDHQISLIKERLKEVDDMLHASSDMIITLIDRYNALDDDSKQLFLGKHLTPNDLKELRNKAQILGNWTEMDRFTKI